MGVCVHLLVCVWKGFHPLGYDASVILILVLWTRCVLVCFSVCVSVSVCVLCVCVCSLCVCVLSPVFNRWPCVLDIFNDDLILS